jgi:hypothetical protein
VRRGVLAEVVREVRPGCRSFPEQTEVRQCPDCGGEHLVRTLYIAQPEQVTVQEMINPAVIICPWAEHLRAVMRREANALEPGQPDAGLRLLPGQRSG